MYHNPAFDYERHQANTTMLIGDVRRMMYGGITVVVLFSFVLMLSGGIEAGLNLMLIVGVPLLILAGAGEALSWWSRRGSRRRGTDAPTIFDQLAEFDPPTEATDPRHRHPDPR